MIRQTLHLALPSILVQSSCWSMRCSRPQLLGTGSSRSMMHKTVTALSTPTTQITLSIQDIYSHTLGSTEAQHTATSIRKPPIQTSLFWRRCLRGTLADSKRPMDATRPSRLPATPRGIVKSTPLRRRWYAYITDVRRHLPAGTT